MPTPYLEALTHLHSAATQALPTFSHETETIPLPTSIGRICKRAYRSPHASPQFDTSAMDGFAVSSTLTERASAITPLRLRVRGTIAAGDEPIAVSSAWEATTPEGTDGCLPCVEIMTGAPFPFSTSARPFDACVRIEDTRAVRLEGEGDGAGAGAGVGQYIEIVKPAVRNQNRRFAGADFGEGDVLLSPGTTIRARHVMALALLGISRVEVYRRLRVAVFSTGSELLSYERDSQDEDGEGESKRRHVIRDSNGPYIQATLGELGVDARYCGIIRDDRVEFEEKIRSSLAEEGDFDAVITTGAVSMGKFDFVRAGLEELGAEVRFHGLGVRPGHPVLFAMVPSRREGAVNGNERSAAECSGPGARSSNEHEVPFFGLPGNPMATVVCLRFLVIPYLRFLHGQPAETPSLVRLNISAKQSPQTEQLKPTALVLWKSEHLRVFWHGKVKPTPSGPEFKVHADQGSSKIKPFLTANAWIMAQEGCAEICNGDLVESFLLFPSSLGDDC